jgi:hypothetical protein
MPLSQTQRTNRRQSRTAILLLIATTIALVLARVQSANAEVQNSSALNRSEGAPPNIGTIGDYLGNSGNANLSLYLPLFGIHVVEGRGELASGQSLSGVSVISVDRLGPSDEAGVRAEHIRVTRAAVEAGESVLLFGALLLFPPAILAIPYIPKISASANDVIIAVDAERTRNINELENSLGNVQAGETIYLSIIRDGRRREIRVLKPAIFAGHAAAHLRLSE